MIKKPTKTEIDWWLQKITRKRSFSNNDEPYRSGTSTFLEELKNVLNSDTQSDISINISYIRKNVINLFSDKIVIENNIPRMSLSSFDIDKTVHIKNLAIGELIITSPGPTPNIVVENCLIKEIKITNVPVNLSLKNSGIFNLNIPGNCLYNFDVDGGFILNIQCPATYQSNPISGSVAIKNVHLGTKKIDGKLAEAQGYRNIRHHLQQLQNPLAASKFHAAELRTDRETDDNWISKLVSYFYDWFSGYGNSISKPIFWFFGLMIAFTLITFFFDDPVLIDDSIKGWKSILAEDGCGAKLARAWTNTLQNTLNPLGILGYKSIVIPKHWWFIPINIVYNLFSIALIALTILAIRRRFRIQSS